MPLWPIYNKIPYKALESKSFIPVSDYVLQLSFWIFLPKDVTISRKFFIVRCKTEVPGSKSRC